MILNLASDLAVIRARCAAATPGKRTCGRDEYGRVQILREDHREGFSTRIYRAETDPLVQEDAELAAACSPDVILLLLARLEELREALRKYGKHSGPGNHLTGYGCPKGCTEINCGVSHHCVCGFDAALNRPLDAPG